MKMAVTGSIPQQIGLGLPILFTPSRLYWGKLCGDGLQQLRIHLFKETREFRQNVAREHGRQDGHPPCEDGGEVEFILPEKWISHGTPPFLSYGIQVS